MSIFPAIFLVFTQFLLPLAKAQDVCEAFAGDFTLHKMCRNAHAQDTSRIQFSKMPVLAAAGQPGMAGGGATGIPAGRMPKAGCQSDKSDAMPMEFCNDPRCFCAFTCDRCAKTEGTLPKAVRKEYRMLTEMERQRFIAAVKKLRSQRPALDSMKNLRTGPGDSLFGTQYDQIVDIHVEGNDWSAHIGPGFAPWHRDYNKRMELTLRRLDRSIGLPYWDTTLDAELPNPADSVLFTDELMGSTNAQGHVQGPFAGPKNISRVTGLNRTHDNVAELEEAQRQGRLVDLAGAPLMRNISWEPNGGKKVISERDVQDLLSKRELAWILGHTNVVFNPAQYMDCKYLGQLYVRPNCSVEQLRQLNVSQDMAGVMRWTAQCMRVSELLEVQHQFAHNFIGGSMEDIQYSPQDPIFFLYHSFIELIWELWRQKWQNRQQRESQYPDDDPNCMPPTLSNNAEPFHANGSGMNPMQNLDNEDAIATLKPGDAFSVRMGQLKDGLSNKYTDQLFEYAPRPTCAMGPNCGSKFLFCNSRTGRCMSKIKLGGNCHGLEGQPACYGGMCEAGRCMRQGGFATTNPTSLGHGGSATSHPTSWGQTTQNNNGRGTTTPTVKNYGSATTAMGPTLPPPPPSAPGRCNQHHHHPVAQNPRENSGSAGRGNDCRRGYGGYGYGGGGYGYGAGYGYGGGYGYSGYGNGGK